MWSRSPRPTERRRLGPRVGAAGLSLLVLIAPLVHAGEVPSAVVTLEAISSGPGEQVAAALPLRFVLLESGQVFVGGTSHLLAGQLGKDEANALERRVNDVRKLPGLGSTVTFGPGPGFRLLLGKSKPIDILVQGDPAAAPAGLLPLANLVKDLAGFGHPSLRPRAPAGYALGVRDGQLVGGCRAWTLPVTLAEAVAAPNVVPAESVTGWPTGATPAQVCSGDKTYVVTLRPLVPGERP